jgi:hypothetical protein
MLGGRVNLTPMSDLPVKEALCDLIREAFAAVKLGNGIGLQEAQGIDDYADKETCASYRDGDEKEDWRRIPSEELCRCNSSLSFFDAEGMRFHLPAYLVAELKGQYGFDLAFHLTHLWDYSIAKFALFNSEQRGAVRAYLRHLAADPGYESDWPHIQRALEGYWHDAGSVE